MLPSLLLTVPSARITLRVNRAKARIIRKIRRKAVRPCKGRFDPKGSVAALPLQTL
jgi:hypothetical protein